MEVVVTKEVSTNCVIKGFELRGEFSEGEHYVAFRKSLKHTREVGRETIARRNFKRSFVFIGKQLVESRIAFAGSFCSRQEVVQYAGFKRVSEIF